MDRYTRYVSSAVSSDGCPRFVFEATRPCTVRDMLLSLGVSKAVVGRLFARGQLLIDECGAGSSDRPLAPQTGLSPGDRVMVECHPESFEVSSHNGDRSLRFNEKRAGSRSVRGPVCHRR